MILAIVLFWIRKENLYQASIYTFIALLRQNPDVKQVQENWERTRGEIYTITENLISLMPSKQKQIIRNMTFDELADLLEEAFQGMSDTRLYEIKG